MKKFNINDNIYIQITDEGWKHLNETVGNNYVKHCIDTELRRTEINGEIWHRLQAHQVFHLLPIKYFNKPLYNTNIMFDDRDLKE